MGNGEWGIVKALALRGLRADWRYGVADFLGLVVCGQFGHRGFVCRG